MQVGDCFFRSMEYFTFSFLVVNITQLKYLIFNHFLLCGSELTETQQEHDNAFRELLRELKRTLEEKRDGTSIFNYEKLLS